MKMKTEQTPNNQTISTSPFPASKKVYLDGELHAIKVPMREISLHDTQPHIKGLPATKNPAVTVYDTSGPYTDPSYQVNLDKGLPRNFEKWILQRNDVEYLSDISSEYGKKRKNDDSLNPIRFPNLNKPLKALPGKNQFTQKGRFTVLPIAAFTVA